MHTNTLVQASIARGHPMSATTTYKKTLKQTIFDEKEYSRGLHLPNAGFVLRKVDELFPNPCGVVRMPVG